MDLLLWHGPTIFLILCSTGVFCLQTNNRTGVTIRVSLSDYSNPHQVLAASGLKCDDLPGSICDPYFRVQLRTQQYSFDGWEHTSETFKNRYNLSGEFYNHTFSIDQELPEALFVAVTILDADSVYGQRGHVERVIADPVIEIFDLLPSIPGRSNALTKLIKFTPENGYVSFTVTVQADCWPDRFGRRCSTPCRGLPVYPPWNQSDPRHSVEIECRFTQLTSNDMPLVTLADLLSKHTIIVVVVAIAALLIIVAMVAGVMLRKRNMRRLQNGAPVNQEMTRPGTASRQLGVATRQTSSYKNPVYNGAHQLQPHGGQRDENSAARATNDSSTGDASVYEDPEAEEFNAAGQPPLPPRLSEATDMH